MHTRATRRQGPPNPSRRTAWLHHPRMVRIGRQVAVACCLAIIGLAGLRIGQKAWEGRHLSYSAVLAIGFSITALGFLYHRQLAKGWLVGISVVIYAVLPAAFLLRAIQYVSFYRYFDVLVVFLVLLSLTGIRTLVGVFMAVLTISVLGTGILSISQIHLADLIFQVKHTGLSFIQNIFLGVLGTQIWKHSRLFLLVLVFAFAYSVAAVAWMRILKQRPGAAWLAVLAVAGAIGLNQGFQWLPAKNLFLEAAQAALIDMPYRVKEHPLPRAADSLATTRAAKVFLVLVEKLGAFQHAGLHARRVGFLLTPQVRKTVRIVESGLIPHKRSTWPAELRELCAFYSRIPVEPHETLNACLPQQLARRGYQTHAFHGGTGAYAARRIFYPLLGFERVLFEEELQLRFEQNGRDIARTRGTGWGGYWDADVLRVLFAEHYHPDASRQFFYLLTLDAHGPLEGLPPGWAEDCTVYEKARIFKSQASQAVKNQLCWREGRINHFLARLAEQIASIRQPFHMVIVGDEPPRPGSRYIKPAQGYYWNQVPYWVLQNYPENDPETTAP